MHRVSLGNENRGPGHRLRNGVFRHPLSTMIDLRAFLQTTQLGYFLVDPTRTAKAPEWQTEPHGQRG